MNPMDFSALTDSALAREIRRRRQTYKKWTAFYWHDCIPFAHGMRLFGKIYIDLMKPEDPFQFMTLLRSPDMVSVRRNRMLENLSELIWKDPGNTACILTGKLDGCKPEVRQLLERILDQFCDLAWEKGRLGQDRGRLLSSAPG